jgi:hypothetical protein
MTAGGEKVQENRSGLERLGIFFCFCDSEFSLLDVSNRTGERNREQTTIAQPEDMLNNRPGHS